jgi:hypothetical protein
MYIRASAVVHLDIQINCRVGKIITNYTEYMTLDTIYYQQPTSQTVFIYLLAGYEQVVGKHDHAAAVCV